MGNEKEPVKQGKLNEQLLDGWKWNALRGECFNSSARIIESVRKGHSRLLAGKMHPLDTKGYLLDPVTVPLAAISPIDRGKQYVVEFSSGQVILVECDNPVPKDYDPKNPNKSKADPESFQATAKFIEYFGRNDRPVVLKTNPDINTAQDAVGLFMEEVIMGENSGKARIVESLSITKGTGKEKEKAMELVQSAQKYMRSIRSERYDHPKDLFELEASFDQIVEENEQNHNNFETYYQKRK